jgi:hypothetical protein
MGWADLVLVSHGVALRRLEKKESVSTVYVDRDPS